MNFLSQPTLFLAPMEGVTDAPMRQWVRSQGIFTRLITEFLRVSENPLPEKVILRHMPELKTPGDPTILQLLGGNPERLAITAARAANLGVSGIDLNFGCPAPTVNRNDGGATLLRHPERIRAIVEAVRQAVPRHISVSAKLRLGWDMPGNIDDTSEAAAQGGADWITIHARSRMQGYAPPVDWEQIGRVKKRLGSMPVVANGDIWSLEDFFKCRELSGCEHYMLGRGFLANPLLPILVAKEMGAVLAPSSLFKNAESENLDRSLFPWISWFDSFCKVNQESAVHEGYVTGRLKQWMRMVANRRTEPWQSWYSEVKRLGTGNEILGRLRALSELTQHESSQHPR